MALIHIIAPISHQEQLTKILNMNLRDRESLIEFKYINITKEKDLENISDSYLLCFFTSPELYISEQISSGNLSDLNTATSCWIKYSNNILSLFLENLEKTSFLDLEIVYKDPEILFNQIKNLTNIHFEAKQHLPYSNSSLVKALKKIQVLNTAEIYDATQAVYEELLASSSIETNLIEYSFEQRIQRSMQDSIDASHHQEQKLESYFTKQQSLETKLQEKEKQLAITDKEKQTLQGKLKHLEGNNKSLQDDKELKNKDLQALKKTIQEVNKNKDQLNAENELALMQIHQLQEELESYFTKQQSLETKLQEKEKQLAITDKEKQALQGKLKHLDSNNKSLQDDKELKNKDLQALKQTIQEINKNKDELNAENELALMQIHQLQEELEFYFIAHKKLKNWEPINIQFDPLSPLFHQTVKLKNILKN